MKSLNLFIGIVATALMASCSSSDSNENTDDPNLMTLNKTIRYYPEQANYQKKIVAYYSNNEIVTDSTFNSQNVLTSRNVWINSGLTRTKTNYNSSNSIVSTIVELFDNSRRLLERVETYTTGSSTTKYIYNSDNTISSGYIDSGSQFVLFRTYVINNNGLIFKEIDNLNNDEISTITFNGSIPVEISETGIVFNYFSNPKPSNLLNTDAQINNAVLRESRLYRVGDYCDNYLRGYNGFDDSYADFNANNYMTFKRSVIFNPVETPSFETFYYYN